MALLCQKQQQETYLVPHKKRKEKKKWSME
jgi:hypothetical protein